MKRSLAERKDSEGGFTLIETIVALVLMGLVLSSLASLTAEWLPNWNRGLDRVQRSESAGIALQRIADDVAASEFVPTSITSRAPLFDGSELSITFVRTSFGPNTRPGLDVIHIGETMEQHEFMTVRSRSAFTPLREGDSLSEQMHLRDPVILLRAPYRLSFAYAGDDLIWKGSWQNMEKLPSFVRLTLRDAASHRELSLSTVVRLHVQVAADCARPGNADCNIQTEGDTQPVAANPADNPTAPAQQQD